MEPPAADNDDPMYHPSEDPHHQLLAAINAALGPSDSAARQRLASALSYETRTLVDSSHISHEGPFILYRSQAHVLELLEWLVCGCRDPDGAALAEGASSLAALDKPSCLRCESAWDGYHIGYRCYTCAKSEHSCICIECFNEGPSLAP